MNFYFCLIGYEGEKFLPSPMFIFRFEVFCFGNRLFIFFSSSNIFCIAVVLFCLFIENLVVEEHHCYHHLVEPKRQVAACIAFELDRRCLLVVVEDSHLVAVDREREEGASYLVDRLVGDQRERVELQPGCRKRP